MNELIDVSKKKETEVKTVYLLFLKWMQLQNVWINLKTNVYSWLF